MGPQLRQMLDTAGLDTVIVPIAGEVRSNISLTQPDGTVTKINEAGPVLSAEECDGLIAAVAEQLPGATWLVCGGSLPAGVPAGWYGVPVAVDSSGPPLAESLRAQPDLIKPNLQELSELTGHVPHTLGEVIDAAQDLRARGTHAVRASLGGDGAVVVDAEGALWGHAPVQKVVRTVGAGDAMLAGYLSCRQGRTHALATALQWGAAAVQHEGTLFSPGEASTPVTITDTVERDRRLHDHDPTVSAAGTAAADRLRSRA